MKNIFTSIFVYMLAISSTFGQLVITEISYNPPEVNTDSLEYMELYNRGTSPINLTKYKFSAGVVYTFPEMILAPKQYLLLTVNDTAFFNVYGKTSLKWLSGALSNSGEALTIVDSMDNVILNFTFADKAPWPTVDDGTDGEGRSIELCNPDADPSIGENWKVSIKDLGFMVNGKQVYGSPGEANSIPSCTLEPDFTIEALPSNQFDPKNLTIEVGKTVRWVNSGGTHNVNGTSATYPGNPASFGNGPVSSTQWTYDFTFTQPGVYNYRCDQHASSMTGTITVNQPIAIDAYLKYSIVTATTTNGEGVADSLNKKCALKGFVYGVNQRPGGLQFTIIDAQNNGIGAFSSMTDLGYTVVEGDEVEIKGVVNQFNGYTQVALDSVAKISSGNALVNPKTVTSYTENDESSLVVIKNVTFKDPSQWIGTGAGFNVTMTNGSTDFVVRIDNDIDAYSGPIPSGALWNVIGLLSQFDSSSPFTEGYQLMPRYLVDFVGVSGSQDPLFGQDIQLFPNPVNHQLTIKTDINPDFVEVYSAQGKLVEKISGKLFVEMANYKSGLYLIKVVKGQDFRTLRVIKQ